MFGNASKPSRIYSYKGSAPLEGAQQFSDQVYLAHRYKNSLIENELQRRRESDETVARLRPELNELKAAWERLDQQIVELSATISARNQGARKRTGTPEERAQVSALKAQKKVAYTAYKDARKEAYGAVDVKAALAEVEANAVSRQKERRAASGLYWGNYLLAEQALGNLRSGCPPKFRRWNAQGAIAVQCQKGLAWVDALLGTDSRVRIQLETLQARPRFNKRGQPLPVADPHSRRSRERQRAYVFVRAGTDEATKKPIFVKMLVHLNRHPPEGARIKWVYLRRRRIGVRQVWSVQFVLERNEWPTNQAAHGVCGLDVGWRKVKDGLRVAYLVGNDGRKEVLTLTDAHLSMWSKVESLQSIRDKNFDAIREKLAAAVNTTNKTVTWEGREIALPEWITEKLKFIAMWKSTARLAGVVTHWRNNRFEGDEALFQELEAWRKQDRHLYDWAEALRSKAIGRRDKIYRIFAAKVAYMYHEVHVEDSNWREVQARPGAEEAETKDYARVNARLAAVGQLIQYVKEKVAVLHKVPAANTTKMCHHCQTINEFDAEKNLFFTCTNCKTINDQDENAAINLRDSQPENNEPDDRADRNANAPREDVGGDDNAADNPGGIVGRLDDEAA